MAEGREVVSAAKDLNSREEAPFSMVLPVRVHPCVPHALHPPPPYPVFPFPPPSPFPPPILLILHPCP